MVIKTKTWPTARLLHCIYFIFNWLTFIRNDTAQWPHAKRKSRLTSSYLFYISIIFFYWKQKIDFFVFDSVRHKIMRDNVKFNVATIGYYFTDRVQWLYIHIIILYTGSTCSDEFRYICVSASITYCLIFFTIGYLPTRESKKFILFQNISIDFLLIQ